FAEHPIFAEIDVIACQREPCCPSLSRTNRTARSRTSGENLFVVLLMMLHPDQKLKPPKNTERFSIPASVMKSCFLSWVSSLILAPQEREALEYHHRRSHVETKMHCVKLLGHRLIARDFDRQVAELQIRIAVLNGYTAPRIHATQAVG
ncbi:hypothetical protein PAF17_17790, partial [Paracoccus sp. Z330]|nr:hypothetical protein [Paracoccus onchidii]